MLARLPQGDSILLGWYRPSNDKNHDTPGAGGAALTNQPPANNRQQRQRQEAGQRHWQSGDRCRRPQ